MFSISKFQIGEIIDQMEQLEHIPMIGIDG